MTNSDIQIPIRALAVRTLAVSAVLKIFSVASLVAAVAGEILMHRVKGRIYSIR
jgi:hypothetical protein